MVNNLLRFILQGVGFDETLVWSMFRYFSYENNLDDFAPMLHLALTNSTDYSQIIRPLTPGIMDLPV